MPGAMSFGVSLNGTIPDHCNTGHEAFAGVVSIAKEHLDMAPESLLSIAASQSPEGEVIPLSSWPQPNVTTLKVILAS